MDPADSLLLSFGRNGNTLLLLLHPFSTTLQSLAALWHLPYAVTYLDEKKAVICHRSLKSLRKFWMLLSLYPNKLLHFWPLSELQSTQKQTEVIYRFLNDQVLSEPILRLLSFHNTPLLLPEKVRSWERILPPSSRVKLIQHLLSQKL